MSCEDCGRQIDRTIEYPWQFLCQCSCCGRERHCCNDCKLYRFASLYAVHVCAACINTAEGARYFDGQHALLLTSAKLWRQRTAQDMKERKIHHTPNDAAFVHKRS